MIPLTGPVTWGMIRAELGISGPISWSHPALRQLAGNPAGQLRLGMLRGKAAKIFHDLNIAFRPEGAEKTFILERRGFWNIDTGSNSSWEPDAAMATSSTMTISEDDYNILYEDGLVDTPPEQFFATSSFQVMSMGGINPVVTGKGHTINAVMETTLNGYATFGGFVVEFAGQGVPADAFNAVEIYNGATLTHVYHRGNAKEPNGTRGTTVDGTFGFTSWRWEVARGAVFPTSGQRRIAFV